MLSELCVRRPVFATMLVMSLVVLGIFSFNALGVDLFPRADPATVNVSLQLPGRCRNRVLPVRWQIHDKAALNAATNASSSARVRFSVTAIVTQLPRAGYQRPSGKPA